MFIGAGDIAGGAGAAYDIGLADDAKEGGVNVVSLGAGRNDPADMDVGRAGGGNGTGADTGGRGGAKDLYGTCTNEYETKVTGNMKRTWLRPAGSGGGASSSSSGSGTGKALGGADPIDAFDEALCIGTTSAHRIRN